MTKARWKRIVDRLRSEGIRGTIRLLAYRPFRKLLRIYCVQVYVMLDLGDSDPLTLQHDLSFRWLDESDVPKWNGAFEGLLPRFLAGRLRTGHSRCFGAFENDGGDLVCFAWIGQMNFPPEWIYGPQVQIPADTAYLYNAVTRTDRRGLGFFALLIAEMSRQLANENITRLFLTVECDNTPSQRAMKKAGFQYVGTHITSGMPFGKVLKRSGLNLPEAERPSRILKEADEACGR